MEHFDKLPEAWQEAINNVIADVVGDEHPDIADAFREMEAQHISECKHGKKPTQSWLKEFDSTFIDFLEGWSAATDKFIKDNQAAFSSWVRGHGEPTTYCPDDEPEYPAFIIRESDLTGEKI
jgi:hypothetical protein